MVSPAFVGREDELAAMRAALAATTALVVEREAGVGESRLVREFRARQGGLILFV